MTQSKNECDYYDRDVINTPSPPLWLLWNEDSQNALCALLQSHPSALNLSADSSVDTIKNTIAALKTKNDQDSLDALMVLHDILELKLIKEQCANNMMVIPGYGNYTVLNVKAGGVSEKFSLISEKALTEKLTQLKNLPSNLPLATYVQKRRIPLFEPTAILKLPKKGHSVNVQREAMALEMSNKLGLKTTKLSMVKWQNKPALFIPFDDILPLTEFAAGKDMGKVNQRANTHYSTLKSLGSGLSANAYVQGMSEGLSLMYLCSDTDAVGGNNQNKGLFANALYIFDQGFYLEDRLYLDSRLSMKPQSAFSIYDPGNLNIAHIRHGRGRNRTLFEDAPIENKFDALIHLKSKQQELKDYCQQVIFEHQQHIQSLKAQHDQTGAIFYSSRTRADLNRLKRLVTDAKRTQKKITQRINAIAKVMPLIDGKRLADKDRDVSKKLLLLEKLLNKPVLFTDDKRPYCCPWTSKHNMRILSATSVNVAPKSFTLTLGAAIAPDLLNMFKRHGVTITPGPQKNTFSISEAHLLNLQESQLFPEHAEELQDTINYLDANDLKLIVKWYKPYAKDNMKIVEKINAYTKILKDNKDLAKAFDKVLQDIKIHLVACSNKGFGQHMLKKLHFDMQQRLQNALKNKQISLKNDTISQAFQAAVRLDQVPLFNEVLLKFLKNSGNVLAFSEFLDNCIQLDKKANDCSCNPTAMVDYQPQILSSEFKAGCDKMLKQFNIAITKDTKTKYGHVVDRQATVERTVTAQSVSNVDLKQ